MSFRWRPGSRPHETDKMLTAAQALLAEHEIGFLTVTISEKGFRVLSPEEMYHSPARAREVFDVSGAGATVIATLAACLEGGLRRETAVELANLAARIVVGKVPIALHELIAALKLSSGLNSGEKVLDWQRAKLRWRSGGLPGSR